jgi:molybdenum cofactor cytidylyltransferase
MAGELNAPLLVEADGARRLPLKAPATHEPAVPDWVNGVVVCAGLRGLGKSLDIGSVHRPEVFSRLSGASPGEPIDVEDLAKVLLSDEGGLKNIPSGARRVVNLTQVDNPTLAGQAKRLGDLLIPVYNAVLASDLQKEGDEVLASYGQVAGVVLAAGGSERLGRPKQLLDWRGKPFVRACAETALEAGLSPVLVVTGAHEDKISQALAGLPVELVHNPEWAQGQSGSVRTAIEMFSRPEWRQVSGAMFLLSDQPQIPVTLIRALLDAYAASEKPIVAPLIDQRRGNPVIFDRVTFPDLLTLKGDAGGRQVFSRYPRLMVPWYDGRDGLDVDTEEDYRRLVDGE